MQNARYLATSEAAEYLSAKGVSIAVATLHTMACRGGGPRFQKNGNRRVYTAQELDAYASSRLGPLVNSTSELTANAA